MVKQIQNIFNNGPKVVNVYWSINILLELNSVQPSCWNNVANQVSYDLLTLIMAACTRDVY